MKDIYLVAAAKLDPRGGDRLERVLSEIKPSDVVFGVSPEEVGRRVIDHENLDGYAGTLHAALTEKFEDSEKADAILAQLGARGFDIWRPAHYLSNTEGAQDHYAELHPEQSVVWRRENQYGVIPTFGASQEFDKKAVKALYQKMAERSMEELQREADERYDEIELSAVEQTSYGFDHSIMEPNTRVIRAIKRAASTGEGAVVYVASPTIILGTYPNNLVERFRSIEENPTVNVIDLREVDSW